MKLITLSILIALGLVLAAVSGCAPVRSSIHRVGSDILLWHSWPERDAAVLKQVVTQIEEIDPATEVILIYVPADDIVRRHIEASAQGIGPDILLANDASLGVLIDQSAIRPIPNQTRHSQQFSATAIAALSRDDILYGLPLSVAPRALYVNRSLQDQALTSFSDIPSATSAERPLVFVPRFEPAYWGIDAFGAGLFDNAGRLTLATSGFGEWLAWLQEAQQAPGMILNPDETALQDLFLTGRAAYYVGEPEQGTIVIDQLGREYVVVTRLPSGPAGPAGPLIDVEAVMLGVNSSDSQAIIAEIVAEYLTNAQQSTTFMRELGRVPANINVEVDPRIYPILAGFARQARSAVALPTTLDRQAFFELGNRAYVNALSGLLTPDEAVCQFGRDLVLLRLMESHQIDWPPGCRPPEPVDR